MLAHVCTWTARAGGQEARWPHQCPVALVKVPGLHPVRNRLLVWREVSLAGRPALDIGAYVDLILFLKKCGQETHPHLWSVVAEGWPAGWLGQSGQPLPGQGHPGGQVHPGSGTQGQPSQRSTVRVHYGGAGPPGLPVSPGSSRCPHAWLGLCKQGSQGHPACGHTSR